MTLYYKVLTHDHRPPLQGGDPLFNGDPFPVTLPRVKLDTSGAECGAGYNFTRDLATAFKIARLWSNGRPAACFVVSPVGAMVERGDKCRTDRLEIIGRCTRAEIAGAIRVLSAPFGEHVERMAASQLAWYDALGRPRRNVRNVERALRLALKTRGLDWELKRYDTAQDIWDARDAWTAWTARDAWDAWTAWDARAARAAWTAWAARAARDAWAAWAARTAWDARAARAAWTAWAARDALIVETAAAKGWTDHDPLLLTAGLRAAYTAGLEIAVPTGRDTLGWAMAE